MTIMTVSQLNRYISFKIKEDKNLHSVLVKGEISNFTNHTKSGHLYFTLKDGTGAVKAVMFSSMAARLNFLPENGMKVIVSAAVQVYERDGVYQLYVNDMQPDGLGAVYLAFEQLKQKLMTEGIFDNEHKKAMPPYPEKIGIVTSPDAAALQDMLNIISRRYPIASITIFPCLVQGKSSPDSICAALSYADKSEMDIIIVGRGGGSIEDLSAFNTEMVARCIYSCTTPIISAIGHETDTTIADYAADLRAPTPSAAAELAVPELQTILLNLSSIEFTIKKRYEACIAAKKNDELVREKQLAAMLPKQRIISSRLMLDEKLKLMNRTYKNVFSRKEAAFSEKIAAVDNLSPLKIMSRGYSLAYKDNRIVKSAGELFSGDKITLRMSDGCVEAEII